MRRVLLGLFALALIPTAFAAQARELPLRSGLQAVDSIPALSRLDGWQAIDDDTLILWATPARPYLVLLDRSSPDLRHVETIAVTSVGSKVRANLDSVLVRGMSYAIREIYRLDREEARDWNRGS